MVPAPDRSGSWFTAPAHEATPFSCGASAQPSPVNAAGSTRSIEAEQIRMADLRELEKEVSALRSELEALHGLFITLVHASADDLELAEVDQEVFPQFTCRNCSRLLGVLNPETEELQIRVRDQYIYTKGAPGSHVRIMCRKCGTENRVEGQ